MSSNCIDFPVGDFFKNQFFGFIRQMRIMPIVFLQVMQGLNDVWLSINCAAVLIFSLRSGALLILFRALCIRIPEGDVLPTLLIYEFRMFQSAGLYRISISLIRLSILMFKESAILPLYWQF